MKITIEIGGSEKDLKSAIAKGWNARFNEELSYKDIGEICNKEDILNAIPYINFDNIEIIEIEK